MSSIAAIEVHGPAGMTFDGPSNCARGAGDIVLMIGGIVSPVVAVLQGPRAVADVIAGVRRLVDRSSGDETLITLHRRAETIKVTVRCRRDEDWSHLSNAIDEMIQSCPPSSSDT
jgi:hypothetical protein